MAAKFFRDTRGNVLPIFTIALIPLIGFVGVAVDYSRASTARAQLQAGLDAAALYLSKEATGLSDEQLTARGQAYFNSAFNHPEVKNVGVTASMTTNAGMYTIKMTATGSIDASFAKLIGQDGMTVGASSEVLWGIKRIELALALDNTGSMSSNSKMTELKKAAKNLVNTLKAAAKKPEDVKISIVPFDTTVNLGTSYKDQEWFDFSPIGSWQWSWSQGWYWVAGTKDNWQGCVIDRDQNFDVQDTAPTTANPSTMFPAAGCGSLVKLLPLTNDWTKLTDKIDAMQPNGNTNVTIGLVWAWHALTAAAPLSEGSAPAPDLDKVIILLTDGDNTQNRWSSTGSLIDARTKKACDNIRDAGIKVYTVRVINGNADLLRDCATTPAMYFDVQQATQLSSVFSAIAQNLANLRIAK